MNRTNSADRLQSWTRFRLFEGLSESEQHAVQAASRTVEFRRRHRIYMPGDPSDQLFILKSGVIKLNIVSPEGRELIRSFLHPGDVFGELSIVDSAPRDHIAEAYEDATVYAVTSEVLQRLAQQSPHLAYEVAKLLGRRMNAYRARVEELLYKSAQARVAHTLLDLAGHHGVPDAEGVVIPLRLSQSDIANLVGLTRETVNFILKDLRRRRLMENQGRSTRVRLPEVLHALR